MLWSSLAVTMWRPSGHVVLRDAFPMARKFSKQAPAVAFPHPRRCVIARGDAVARPSGSVALKTMDPFQVGSRRLRHAPFNGHYPDSCRGPWFLRPEHLREATLSPSQQLWNQGWRGLLSSPS